jgi:hypothetical protein
MRTFGDDYDFGKESEIASLPALRQLSSAPLEHNEGQWGWDFVSKDCLIELKSRNCSIDEYDDIMLEMIKVMKASQEEGRRIFFAFRYAEGLFYTEYDPDRFSTYRIQFNKNKDRQGYTETMKPRIYIPKNDLICLMKY